MGFLSAVRDIGALAAGTGWEAYLKFPLGESNDQEPGEGNKVIRVWLAMQDPGADQLDVRGVEKMDLVDYMTGPEMKQKYLYRDRVGKNISWGFTPLFKMGKPKKDVNTRKKALVGENGDWESNTKSIYNKLKHRLLNDYEACEIFSPGSVDRIMAFLSGHVDDLAGLHQGKGSFLLVFGVAKDGLFCYPGEIPAFVQYFRRKLDEHVQRKGGQSGIETACSCCGERTGAPATVDKVFKFATFDKVNVLPGLNKQNLFKVLPVCQACLEKLTAGRELIERELTDSTTIWGINIWLVPELVGFGGDSGLLKNAINRLNVDEKGPRGMGQEGERRFFRKVVKVDRGVVFHFLFWESLQAQERVHLMVEDVPPSRLAKLALAWQKALEICNLDWEKDLDTGLKTFYSACMALSGKSKEDKNVMRDYVIKIIGRMLRGECIPAGSFKTMFVRRIPKLVFDSDSWANVRKAVTRGQLIVEFMEQVNREVVQNETELGVS